MAIDPLWQTLQRLSPVQRQLLLEVTQAMLRQVVEEFDPDSNIAAPEFRESFRNRLLIHHATNEARLTKKAFEYAFRAASLAAGRQAAITSSQTNPGADVTVDGVPFSLKTEAAARMSADFITISKLSEGRWIQQCSTLEELAAAASTRIPAHLERYECILTLRAMNTSPSTVRYALVEIPRPLLLRVAALAASDFSPRTKNGGSTARVRIEGQEAFTLILDGSDGKITVKYLRTSLCTRHCAWDIPTVTPAPDDEPDASGAAPDVSLGPA